MAERRSALATGWRRISTRLVPVMAVITAFLIGIPFMILTGAQGDVGRGLQVSGAAYSALIEGSTGLVINDLVSRDDASMVFALAAQQDMTSRELNSLARSTTQLIGAGVENVRRYATVLERVELTDEEFDALGESIAEIEEVGAQTLQAMLPLINDFSQMARRDVRALADPYASKDDLSAEDRAELEAAAPSAAQYSDVDLLRYMGVVNREGIATLERLAEQIGVISDLGLDVASEDAAIITEIAAVSAEDARELLATMTRLEAAGITDYASAAEQMAMVRRMFEGGVFSQQDSVNDALQNEFDSVLVNNLVVRRPGNRLLIDEGASGPVGIILVDFFRTPDDPSDDRPDVVYLRLGNSALLFIISNLESTIVRSIPFIVAGLAVALGFKAGLFNIGAEGQLYAGAMLAVFVGYSPMFDALPGIIRLPLVILMGLIGGFLWGAIPGALRAFTGAHEVINTIMLNFVAILTVDWLIKTPGLMQDAAASIPRTPFIAESARLPAFSQISPIWFVIAAVVIGGLNLYWQRKRIAQNPQRAIRPIVYGLLVLVGGFFLAWIAVRDRLHLGFVLMLLAVYATDWFLTRTTLGFELRTVGVNPNAARYAGMNVRRNIVLALALSGMLAGLAGTIEVAGVQYNMQPSFFSGVGFDAIAVALLARTNPRNMIASGLLWGGLLTGAGLMQINANISIDLVRIIQALIIMFIAADVIIRTIWRVPEASTEEKEAALFSKGWGG
ncbi:MAG TPA: ABC transporter permease [Spirillospora sp.]|jgi:ABC-type uncharacterized transport system permease subunit|nr:ABC transporter permease [Spirillospora sp.]